MAEPLEIQKPKTKLCNVIKNFNGKYLVVDDETKLEIFSSWYPEAVQLFMAETNRAEKFKF